MTKPTRSASITITPDRCGPESIEGTRGNRTVQLTPHCLPNGDVTVSDVRGTSQGELVTVADHQPDGPHGRFESATITDVSGCGGACAQETHPDLDSYVVAPSRAAFLIRGEYATFLGELTWPAPPSPGGLADGGARHRCHHDCPELIEAALAGTTLRSDSPAR